MDPAVGSADVGEVRDPQLVRPGDGEVAFGQSPGRLASRPVWWCVGICPAAARQAGSRARAARPRTGPHPRLAVHCGPDLPGHVDAVAVLVHLPDLLSPQPVGSRAGRLGTGSVA